MLKRDRWLGAVVVLLATVSLGCVGSAPTMRSLGPEDLKSLAGTWQGTVTSTRGTSSPITMRINDSGTYVWTAGVYSTQGTVQVRGSQVIFASQTTSGGQSADRVASAVLSQRIDGTEVLTGTGTSASGPFSFFVSRPR